MDATYNTTAIVLRREATTGDNSRVFLYTKDHGKIHLIARGTAKLSSKLAAHLEPLNMCDMMVIKGKQYDYAGSCVSMEVFSMLKKNYEAAVTAGSAVAFMDSVIKEHEPDERIFAMLKTFLEVLNTAPFDYAVSLRALRCAFTLKLIAMLGYTPVFDELRVGSNIVSKPMAELMARLLRLRFAEVASLAVDNTLMTAVSGAVDDYRLYVFD